VPTVRTGATWKFSNPWIKQTEEGDIAFCNTTTEDEDEFQSDNCRSKGIKGYILLFLHRYALRLAGPSSCLLYRKTVPSQAG
jgi:hypothetical protein